MSENNWYGHKCWCDKQDQRGKGLPFTTSGHACADSRAHAGLIQPGRVPDTENKAGIAEDWEHRHLSTGFSIICWGWWQNHTSVFPCFGQDSPLFGTAVCQIHLSQACLENQVSNWLQILYYTSVKQDKGRGESSPEHVLGEWFSWNAAFPVAQKLPFHLKAIKDYSRVPAITKPKRLFVHYLCSTGFYFSSDCLQAG